MDIEKLKLIMQSKNISMYKLAKYLNTSSSTISDIINKRNKNPRIDTVAKIAKVLNVKVDDLLLDEYK